VLFLVSYKRRALPLFALQAAEAKGRAAGLSKAVFDGHTRIPAVPNASIFCCFAGVMAANKR